MNDYSTAKRLRQCIPDYNQECLPFTENLKQTNKSNFLSTKEKIGFFGEKELVQRTSDLFSSTLEQRDVLQISISSLQRDKSQYPSPSDFEIDLDLNLNRIKRIYISHISFPNKIFNINETNNLLYLSEVQSTEDTAHFFVLAITPGYYLRQGLIDLINSIISAATFSTNYFLPGNGPVTNPSIITSPVVSLDTDTQQIICKIGSIINNRKIYFHGPPQAGWNQTSVNIAKVLVQGNVTVNYPSAGNQQVDIITVTTQQFSNITNNAKFTISCYGSNGTVFNMSNIMNTVSSTVACPAANLQGRYFSFLLPAGTVWPYSPNSSEQFSSGTITPDAAFNNIGGLIGLYESTESGIPIPILDMQLISATTNNIIVTKHPHGLVNLDNNITIYYTHPTSYTSGLQTAGAGTSSTGKVVVLTGSNIQTTVPTVRTATLTSPNILITKYPMTLGSEKFIYIRVRVNNNMDIGNILNKNSSGRFLAKVRYISDAVDVLFDNLNKIITDELLKIVTPKVSSLRITLYDDNGNYFDLKNNQDWNFVITFEGNQME